MRKRNTLLVAWLFVAVLAELWLLSGKMPKDPPPPPPRLPAVAPPLTAEPSLGAPQPQGRVPANIQPRSDESLSPNGNPESFLNGISGGSRWRALYRADGRVSSFTDGIAPGAGTDAKSAFALARGVAARLGVPLSNESLERHSKVGSDLAIAYHFPQFSGPYLVYGGEIAVLTRSSDGAAFLVNTDLKPVERTDDPVLAASAARDLVARRFEKRASKIDLRTPNPVVFADEKPHELAWEFLVEVTQPALDRRELLIGATSGRILRDETVLIH